MAMPMTLGLLAVRNGCELRGNPSTIIDGVATLAGARPGSLAFLANPLYRHQLAATRASAVVLEAQNADDCPVACLVCSNPYLTYARIAAELHPPPPRRPGVSAGAHVGARCHIPESCQVDAGAHFGEGAVLGERVHVGANVVIGAACHIGDDSVLRPGVVLYDNVEVGQRCLIHSGVVIGADGFGIARDSDGSWTKVPQLGRAIIGNDVEIGANTTIDRGAIEDTVIGDGVKLDNQIQIGHNVTIGRHTVMAALSGIAGSTRVGQRCIIGADAALGGHLTIADDVVIGGGSRVTQSIGTPGVYGGALPASEVQAWRKNAVRFGQLDELSRRVRKLEAAARKHAGESQ